MRAYQVFQGLAPERAESLFRELREKSPAAFQQAVAVAAGAMRARPVYLLRQPFEKQARAVRQALSRVAANELAEDLLATYFLECRRDLVVEWLDEVGLEHDEGTLKDDHPEEPPEARLREAVERYLGGEDAPVRELFLRAFAAQRAVEWPTLEAILAERGRVPA